MTYRGPYRVRLDRKPIPEIEHPRDAIVRVTRACVCGSDLHLYHGLVPDTRVGQTFGHEFVGVVEDVGPDVHRLKVGDRVVVPFNIFCGECYFCQKGLYGNCHNVNPNATAAGGIYGYSHTTGGYDGGQAEYVRVPFADGTVMRVNDPASGFAALSDQALVLMADIFPTGFFGAKNAFALLQPHQPASEAVVVVIGCGPVGLCAIVAALEYKPRKLFAVDNVPSRLELAKGLGAEPLDFSAGTEEMVRRVKEATEGRGADAVIEVVGLSPALRTAFDLIRPFGVISSIGVHNAEVS